MAGTSTPAKGFDHPIMTPADLKRFLSKQAKVGTCTEWTGARDKDGYGLFKISGKMHRATRISYELAHGFSVPKGILVCHNCPDGDNPACVDVEHLFLGTPKENSEDMVAKGRSFHPVGELHPGAKLTWSDVHRIRLLFDRGETSKDLAQLFGVCRASIQLIVRQKTWRTQL